jgi:bifunctional UDP-N-acetylglucosamine pyrophosphorylase/glucosamine-1-phosphate N-acetyltransferase
MRNQIVILAGGKGTRMGNPKVPKVLVMLKNKPLILHVLDEIEKIHQLAKPVIVVGFGAGKVQQVLGNHYLYAFQDKQLGTAHALMAAKNKIKAENILVLYGDHPFIKSESLKSLISSHFKTGSKISMLTTQVKNFTGYNKPFEHFAKIIREPVSHQVVKIVEYKDATDAQRKIKEINPGIYMFNTKWLWENIKKIGNNNKQKEYYLTDIVGIAISQGEKVNSILANPEEVIGVNSTEDLAIAERKLQKATE